MELLCLFIYALLVRENSIYRELNVTFKDRGTALYMLEMMRSRTEADTKPQQRNIGAAQVSPITSIFTRTFNVNITAAKNVHKRTFRFTFY